MTRLYVVNVGVGMTEESCKEVSVLQALSGAGAEVGEHAMGLQQSINVSLHSREIRDYAYRVTQDSYAPFNIDRKSVV